MLLWVRQILLGLAFLAYGCLLLFPPAAILQEIATVIPDWFRLFLGAAEWWPLSGSRSQASRASRRG